MTQQQISFATARCPKARHPGSPIPTADQTVGGRLPTLADLPSHRSFVPDLGPVVAVQAWPSAAKLAALLMPRQTFRRWLGDLISGAAGR